VATHLQMLTLFTGNETCPLQQPKEHTPQIKFNTFNGKPKKDAILKQPSKKRIGG